MNEIFRKTFLPDQTRISQVRLRTANLERALGFYTGPLGLRIVERTGGSGQVGISATGSSPAIIVMYEERPAAPRPPKATGLYHFAIRYPTRRDLAHALQRLARNNYPIRGASDHSVSEAIYLSDADGNGVELYADRPRAQWIWRNDQIAMTTGPLDIENLLPLTEGQPAARHVPPQTRN